METITLWVVAVVIPAAAILAYWALARRQVRRSTAEAERRLEAERALTARVSHQVRNPLTVIYGFSEALLDSEMDDTSEIRSVVSIINAEALGVSRTVENLVAENQVATNQLSVRSIAFEPAKELERAITPFTRIGAEICLESRDIIGQSDPILFRQVVQNLVSNAVRHGGSDISVISVSRNGSYECTVADDGPGLPPRIASELFAATDLPTTPEPNATKEPKGIDPVDDGVPRAIEPIVTDHVEDALGIGLSTSIALAEKLGGSLQYERTVGATMFTLKLPTADWPAPPAAKEPIPDPVDGDSETADRTEDDDPSPAPPLPEDTATISFDQPADDADTGVDDTIEAGTSA